MRLHAGQPVIPFNTSDIYGHPISLQDYKGDWLLLTFLRFITCPRCSVRIQSLTLSYPLLRDQGLQVLAIVESTNDLILKQAYAREAPFPIIADPGESLYKTYGVKNSRLGLFLGGLFRKEQIREAARLGFGQPTVIGNDYRMPADFIIDPNQTIQLAHYGRDSGDHLTFVDMQKSVFPKVHATVKH